MSGELGLRGRFIVSMQGQFLSWEILAFPDDPRQVAVPDRADPSAFSALKMPNFTIESSSTPQLPIPTLCQYLC